MKKILIFALGIMIGASVVAGAAISDKKKVQSFVNLLSIEFTNLQDANTSLQSLKTKWQAHNPSTAGTVLTDSQVTSCNQLVNQLNTMVTVTYAGIIDTINGKVVPSHRGAALE